MENFIFCAVKIKKSDVFALFQNSLAPFNVNNRSNRPEVFCKIDVLRNFAEFIFKRRV